MSGYKTGLLSCMKKIALHVKLSGCSIHREDLVTKRLPEHIKTTLQEVMKIINFINSQPLQSRLFQILCKDIRRDHVELLLHIEIR